MSPSVVELLKSRPVNRALRKCANSSGVETTAPADQPWLAFHSPVVNPNGVLEVSLRQRPRFRLARLQVGLFQAKGIEDTFRQILLVGFSLWLLQ